jgi:hypothetical protein
MIRHVWSVLCSQLFVEAETDNAALTVLETLSLGALSDPPPKVVGPTFELVSLWYCDVATEPFAYKVKATGPSGREIAEAEVPTAGFQPPRHRVRSRLKFPGVAYDGPGVYWFRVMRLVDGQEILDAEIPLAIG